MSETQELPPALKAQLEHGAGTHCVIEHYRADGTATRRLLKMDSIEGEAWQEAAFTNGAALVEIRIRWDKEAADELREMTP